MSNPVYTKSGRCTWGETCILLLLACLIPGDGVSVFRALAQQATPRYCKIEVVEKGTGWPVPLVELRTVHHLKFVTDNAGIIAFDAPELWGKETWFDVRGHGYERARDGFGYRGIRLTPEPGKNLRVEVTRTIIAKRLGRLTGAGLFAESQKLGMHQDWRESGILGCDSVQKAVYHGKLVWAWGDTLKANYPLGIFDMSSATTSLRPLNSFEPPLKLKLDYFVDAKGPRGVAKLPGSGPTWLSGYVALPDKSGRERLVASYAKIKPPMDAYERGLCQWNDDTQNFERLTVLWTNSPSAPKKPVLPDGHPAFYNNAGRKWVLFGNPLPTLKCHATYEAWRDPAAWETLSPQESLVSASDGAAVKPHSGSIAWSNYRKRWITVFMQVFGKPSAFGEIWYAEADAPTGPWGKTIKILSHENYTFYNPRIHEELTDPDSPTIIFEGTYTADFGDKPQETARYNYNQMLYRLDLNDPALAPVQ